MDRPERRWSVESWSLESFGAAGAAAAPVRRLPRVIPRLHTSRFGFVWLSLG